MPRPPSGPFLLRSAGVVMIILGASLTVWLLDTTVIDPWSEIQGALPFWIPFLATILIGCTALTVLFFRAARRIESDEFSNPRNISPSPPLRDEEE